MAGIVPALETHHGIGIMAEQIDDLALALVTPLGAQNHYAFIHHLFSRPGGWSHVFLRILPAAASLPWHQCRNCNNNAPASMLTIPATRMVFGFMRMISARYFCQAAGAMPGISPSSINSKANAVSRSCSMA